MMPVIPSMCLRFSSLTHLCLGSHCLWNQEPDSSEACSTIISSQDWKDHKILKRRLLDAVYYIDRFLCSNFSCYMFLLQKLTYGRHPASVILSNKLLSDWIILVFPLLWIIYVILSNIYISSYHLSMLIILLITAFQNSLIEIVPCYWFYFTFIIILLYLITALFYDIWYICAN